MKLNNNDLLKLTSNNIKSVAIFAPNGIIYSLFWVGNTYLIAKLR